MLWFWFYIALVAMFIALAFWGACGWADAYDRNRGRPSYDKSDATVLWGIGTGIAAIAAVVMVVVLAATIIDRHVAPRSCAKRDAASSAEYKWVDYHFFSYECVLVTPSGNITETPILPHEDVGGER